MKLMSAVAALAAALTLAACGHDSSTDASGLRNNASATATRGSSGLPATPAPVTSAAAGSATPGAAPAPPSARTTCGEFKSMDTESEKTVVAKVLEENPGSKFEGSPNVALGTAKLVCLSSSRADTPVAVAIGVTGK
jgi:hypothetical protein